MKGSVAGALVIAASMAISGNAGAQDVEAGSYGSAAPDTVVYMTKDDVVSLSKSGIGDSLIIFMLETSGSTFELTPRDVLDLLHAGVHEDVIDAMVATPAGQEDPGTSEEIDSPDPSSWYAAVSPFCEPWFWSPLYVGVETAFSVPVNVAVVPAPAYRGDRVYTGGGWGGGNGGGFGGFHGGGRRR